VDRAITLASMIKHQAVSDQGIESHDATERAEEIDI
jgi:hypothetical protein